MNEIALSRFDIIDHLAKNEFSRIFVYEAKLKEINDHLSWTYADERVVKKLWEENFKSVFREEIKTGVLTVGRIGGSIIMMQKEGTTLSEETEKKLRKFKDSNFGSKYNNTRGVIDHEIGFAEINTARQKPEDVFQKIFTEPTKDWLRKTFNRIVNNEEEYRRFIQLLGNDEDDPEHTLTFLSARYFTGNRWKNRGITAREVLTSLMESFRQDEVTDVIERIGEIGNQLDLIAKIKSQNS